MAKEVRSIALNIRITPAMKAALDRIAEREKRTVSNWIYLLLEKAIAESDEGGVTSKRRK
jgi:hypothetical protein